MPDGKDGFDIKFKLLPPELQMKLWVLALDADTSQVNLAYSRGAFRTSLAYNYGGNVEASIGLRRYSSEPNNPLLKVGFDPGTKDLSTGLVFRGFKFGATADLTRPSYGASLSYGRELLPFPDELGHIFNAANGGLLSMAGDIRSAPDNPLKWFDLHSDDKATISKAVSTGKQIANYNKSPYAFGGKLSLSHAPDTGLTIKLGVGVSF